MSLIVNKWRMVSTGRKGGPKEMGDPLQKQQTHSVTGRAPKQSDDLGLTRARSEKTTDSATPKQFPSQVKARFPKGKE